jgi:hypothetical protein
MRKFASVSPMFWLRGTGKRLRGRPEAQIVALYLMTCPGAAMVGIFPLSLATLCNDTGLSRDAALTGLAMCRECDFAEWDEDEELVWVPALPLYQVGEAISVNKDGKRDYRHRAILKALDPFRGHRFHSAFLARYGEAYLLGDVANKPLGSPLEAPCKGSKNILKGHESNFNAPDVPVPVPALSPGLDQPVRSEQKPDPTRDAFTGRLPHQRADVLRVFAAFASAFALPNAVLLRGDPRADQIAERIDAFGEPACLLVVKHAAQDGMVSGRADKGNKHESVPYIFGNPTAFERILKAGTEREGRGTRQVSGSVAAARARAL